jgi:hypothetical protein
MVWMALPYVLAGVVAWWRRPESRFGTLMVVAGFLGLLATLCWSNAPPSPSRSDRRSTSCRPCSSCRCYWPFPTGRLERRLERVIVALGYFTALGARGRGQVLQVAGAVGSGT